MCGVYGQMNGRAGPNHRGLHMLLTIFQIIPD